MRIYTLLISLFLCVQLCSAHLPRLVDAHSAENSFMVNDPEISQAFYGRLKGQPHYFKIVSPEPFLLYVNILVPEAMGARIDFAIDITHNNELIAGLKDGAWNHFYERFAGDNYIRGPALERQVAAGSYLIKVSNEDDLGYYILAIGKKEWFTPSEIINLYRVLPQIKEEFFQKSPLTAYFNLFTLLLVIMMFGMLWVIRSIIRWLISYKKA